MDQIYPQDRIMGYIYPQDRTVGHIYPSTQKRIKSIPGTE